MPDLVETRIVSIHTSDGLTLKADYGEVESSKTGVILVHGLTTNRGRESVLVAAEPRLKKSGFSTLRFDFRGHGDRQTASATEVRISGSLLDLAANVAFMRNNGIERIGLVGASFGAAIAALYAADKHDLIRALFLENPVLNFRPVYLEPTTAWGKEFFGDIEERTREYGFLEVGTGKFRLGEALFDEMQRFDPAESLIRYPHEIMVVHGDRDTRVDVRDVMESFERLPNPHKRLEILTGAEHGFHVEPYRGQVVAMIVDFFNNNLC